MTLSRATFRDRPLHLEGEAPFASRLLAPWIGKAFKLPCDDPWVLANGTPAHAYLESAQQGWRDHPEYMDFHDPGSPVHDLKAAERDLYLHHWPILRSGCRILDVGCGVGRLTLPALDAGATVHAVDPDLQALQHLAWAAAERDGHIDLHWTTTHALPDVQVDVAVAAEVLCYVPDAEGALSQLAQRVRPGGTILLSVEARWGWAAAGDAPAAAIEAAVDGDGIVHVPGDRWVQTYDHDRLVAWVTGAGLTINSLIPSHWVLDGPLEDVAPASLSLEELIAIESRMEGHPVWGPLHRLWLVSATVPT